MIEEAKIEKRSFFNFLISEIMKEIEPLKMKKYASAIKDAKWDAIKFWIMFALDKHKENIRSLLYPRYILFGDCIIRQVEIDNVMTLSVAGGSLKRMTKFAHILSILPQWCIIIHLGINDLVDFDEISLACCLVSTATTISTEHGITVIISTILRCRGTLQSQSDENPI
uniref:Uncharacterized protein n=1 Tax=Romanomermis culicivorax TaxID=13658 RepID=A0A915J1B6_ROMCU